jgi:hypothetical protein
MLRSSSPGSVRADAASPARVPGQAGVQIFMFFRLTPLTAHPSIPPFIVFSNYLSFFLKIHLLWSPRSSTILPVILIVSIVHYGSGPQSFSGLMGGSLRSSKDNRLSAVRSIPF